MTDQLWADVNITPWEQQRLDEQGLCGVGAQFLCWRRTNLCVCIPLFVLAVLFPAFIAVEDEEGRRRELEEGTENSHTAKAYQQLDRLEGIATLIWAVCNLVGACLMVAALLSWTKFRKSQKLLCVAFVAVSLIPFCTYLWLPFRLGIDGVQLVKGMPKCRDSQLGCELGRCL